jgi:hypothetical protein
MDLRNWGFKEWKDALELIAVIGGIIVGVGLYMNRLNQIPGLAEQAAKMQESINKIQQDTSEIANLRDELKKVENDQPQEIPGLRSRLAYLAEFDCKVHQKQCADILSHFELAQGFVKDTDLSTGEAKVQTTAGETAVHFVSATSVLGAKGGETTVSKTQNQLATSDLMAIYNYNTHAVEAFVVSPTKAPNGEFVQVGRRGPSARTEKNPTRCKSGLSEASVRSLTCDQSPAPHTAPSYQGGEGNYVDPDTGRKLPPSIRTLR